MDSMYPFRGAYRGRPVLVTGDTGFKGSWMSIWLKQLGAAVIGFSTDSAPPSISRNYRLCGLHQHITHVTGDIRDADAVESVIHEHRPEVIFHFAAQPLVSVSYQEPKRTFDTNCGGVINLLEAVRRTRFVRAIVVITTDKVYKDQHSVHAYRETDSLGGHDPYSASKAQVELAVESYRSSWNESQFSAGPVAIATARGGNVIGGGDFAVNRLIPDVMRALMQDVPIFVRNPNAIRPWQHVLDLLSGYLWLGSKLLGPKNSEFSQAWNFGPSVFKDISSETMVKQAIEYWGIGRYQLATPTANEFFETEVLRLDATKAAQILNWQTTYDWNQAVRATVEWFKDLQQQIIAGNSVNMLPVCVRQINDYVEKAKELQLTWTAP